MKDKKIIICDIDGTIANLEHRLHFIKNPDGSKKKKPDWDSFHKTCEDDTPYKDVIEILRNLYDAGRRTGIEGSEREIYFFSGRNEWVRNETIAWLYHHVISHSMCHPVEIEYLDAKMWEARGVSYSLREERGGKILRSDEGGNAEGKYFFLQPNLFMRSEGDRRPDTVVKLEMMKSLGLTPDDVLCILDDRQAVVDMWRANGFRVMQVDAWKEPAPVHHLTQEKLESLNKAELMFLIGHERQHFEKHMEVKVGDLALYNRAKRALHVLNETTWQDELRDHVDKTAKEHNTSKWTQTGKGTSPNATPIPILDTPDFDLDDIPEENNSVAEQNLAADEYINRKLEKKEDEK